MPVRCVAGWSSLMLPRSAVRAITVLALIGLCAFCWGFYTSTVLDQNNSSTLGGQTIFWRFTSTSAAAPRGVFGTGAIADPDAAATFSDGQNSSTNFHQFPRTCITELQTQEADYAGHGKSPSHGSSHAQLDIARRCQHTTGSWCQSALSFNSKRPPISSQAGVKNCSAGCNAVGNCNADTGVCDCPAGTDTFHTLQIATISVAVLRSILKRLQVCCMG